MAFVDAFLPVRPKVDRHTDLVAFTTLRAQHMERVAAAARLLGYTVGLNRSLECVSFHYGHTSEAYKELKILLDAADERTVTVEPDERQRVRFEQRLARKVRAVQATARDAWRGQEWFIGLFAGAAFLLGVIVGCVLGGAA